MVAIVAAIGLMMTGAGFLLAAAYLELSAMYSPPIGAAIVGAGLVVVAGVLWLTAGRSKPATALMPMANAAVGIQPADEAVEKVVTALKQESPLTVVAAAAGLLFGLFLRGRHH